MTIRRDGHHGRLVAKGQGFAGQSRKSRIPRGTSKQTPPSMNVIGLGPRRPSASKHGPGCEGGAGRRFAQGVVGTMRMLSLNSFLRRSLPGEGKARKAVIGARSKEGVIATESGDRSARPAQPAAGSKTPTGTLARSSPTCAGLTRPRIRAFGRTCGQRLSGATEIGTLQAPR